jgi:glycosyltransferase involved in cell wall biosynthesis
MTPRYHVVIPVYNHPKTLVQVVRDCLEKVDYNILIIDDGSRPRVRDLFLNTELLNHTRVQIVEHQINQGKGAALQTAFSWAIQNSYTHTISLDADGQHFPEDIPRLVQKSLAHPWSLILGDREMLGPNIPASSQFGKKFSNFWIKFETQKSVGDSQSGFRIYPLFHIQNLNFLCHHYDFEIEVITRLMWLGINVENTRVQVKYEPGSERVTHFDKWKDNLRLT